ncbi:hypothetical protein CAPTEDRAFT_222052 [Capitella teleta]|uniref:ETS domain-containing protein n=1 Tax=Capitella teleta TaxID=283909 RepID=R7TIX5_CAPTE|nr:hypothetical protein CAPTEDRAFT_222052 [Capitella teleta]|eukprot:ELT91496.1 hypothetical protein CAPTEDRAFT_222052 [Capitella teleta]
MPSASPYHQAAFHETSIYCEGEEAGFLNLASPFTQTPVEAATASNSSADDIDMMEEVPRTYATLEPQRRGADVDSQMIYTSCLQETSASDIKHLKRDVFLSSCDSCEPQCWTQRMPELWSVDDVIAWIYEVADKYRISPDEIYAENFNQCDGKILCSMSVEEFEACDSKNGRRFHDCLQDLRRATSGSGMPVIVKEEPNLHTINSINNEFEPISGSDSDNDTILPSITSNNHHSFPSHRANDLSSTCAMVGSAKSSTFDFNIDHPPREQYSPFCGQYQPARSVDNYPRTVRDFNNNNNRDIDQTPKRRGPGRPRKNPIDGPFGGKSKKKPENEDKVLLWKFLRDRLLDDSCNPRIIKWEDKSNGIFRIVSSAEVSRLWGEQKKNNRMNYEKMSRAIRFCRDKAFFSEMPKDGNFPKKLCFKFGDKATGWR